MTVAFQPNPDQDRAIRSLGRPLVITAGAGSGKTWVLAKRFVTGISPDSAVDGWRPAELGEVLAITYTDKAAGELAERVRRACAQDGLVDQARHVDEAWISTIHSYCNRFLKRHALEAGLDPGFRIVRDVESGALRARVSAEALEAAVAADPRVAALVGSVGWRAAADAIQDAYDRARAMGRSARELTTPLRQAEPGEVDRLLARMSEVYERAGEEFGGCSDGKTMSKCRDHAAGGVRSVAVLRETEHDDVERALLLRRVPNEFWFDAKVEKERVAGFRQELSAITDRATEIVAADAASALVFAARTFEERLAEEKAALGVVDFDDLQLETRDALRDVPGLAERYRREFRLVMVDEFQDTNELQTSIVRLVSAGDLCTVGDEHQSIYGFRYADVENFVEYVDGMRREGADSVSLSANYRSHADILGFVNSVFASEQLFGAGLRPLEHGRDESGDGVLDWPGGPRVSVVFADGPTAAEAEAAEAELVAEKVAQLVASGVRQNEIAVLMRTLGPMRAFERAMRRRGLRVAVTGGGDFFADPAVFAVRALACTIANLADDEAAAAILAGPMVGLSADGLYAVREAASAQSPNAPLWAGLGGATLGARDSEKAARAREAIDGARARLGTRAISEVILGAIEVLGYDMKMLGMGLDGEHAYANTLKVARLADAFEATGGVGLAEFEAWLVVKEEIGDREAPASVADESIEAVRFMTIHAAKGLEFPVVVLPILGRSPGSHDTSLVVTKGAEGPEVLASLPASEPGDADSRRPPLFRAAVQRAREDEAAEARRLFYVGCTRAREALILSGRTKLDGSMDATMAAWLRGALRLEAPLEPGTVTAPAGAVPVDVTVIDQDTARPWEAAPTMIPAPTSDADPGGALPRASEAGGPAWDAPRAQGADEEVSYTLLERFHECGRRFLLQSVAGIGGLTETEPGALGFGAAVHAALLLSRGTQPPSPERIGAIAKSAGLDEEAISRLDAAVAAVLGSDVIAAAADLGGVRKEAPFAVALGELGPEGRGAPYLQGSLDLVAGGPTGAALVVDYKTGTGDHDKTDAQLLEKHRLQAECYAIAVLEEGATSVDVCFILPEVLGAQGAPRTVTHSFLARELPGLEEGIRSRIASLRSGPYQRRARYDPGCKHCPAYRSPLCDMRGPRKTAGTQGA